MGRGKGLVKEAGAKRLGLWRQSWGWERLGLEEEAEAERGG